MSLELDDFIDDCSNREKLIKIESILDEHLTIDDLENMADRLLGVPNISDIYRELGHDESEIYEDIKDEIKNRLCVIPSVELDKLIGVFKLSKNIRRKMKRSGKLMKRKGTVRANKYI